MVGWQPSSHKSEHHTTPVAAVDPLSIVTWLKEQNMWSKPICKNDFKGLYIYILYSFKALAAFLSNPHPSIQFTREAAVVHPKCKVRGTSTGFHLQKNRRKSANLGSAECPKPRDWSSWIFFGIWLKWTYSNFWLVSKRTIKSINPI